MNRLWRVVLGPLRSTEPEALPRESYWRSVWPVLLLAVAIGLQASVVAMVVFGPRAPKPAPELLTRMGHANMRPEWDLLAFEAGCLFTVLLCFVSLRLWNARLRRPDGPRAVRSGALFHLLVAAVSLWIFFGLAGAELAGAEVATLAAPGAAALLALAAYHLYARLRGSGS